MTVDTGVQQMRDVRAEARAEAGYRLEAFMIGGLVTVGYLHAAIAVAYRLFA